MLPSEPCFPFEQVSDERVRQSVQIRTTEHFTLQSARGTVTSEAMSRQSRQRDATRHRRRSRSRA
jgi:hypothetical protein